MEVQLIISLKLKFLMNLDNLIYLNRQKIRSERKVLI